MKTMMTCPVCDGKFNHLEQGRKFDGFTLCGDACHDEASDKPGLWKQKKEALEDFYKGNSLSQTGLNKTIKIVGNTEKTRRTGVIHLRHEAKSRAADIDDVAAAYKKNPSIDNMFFMNNAMMKYNRAWGALVEASEYPFEVDLEANLDYTEIDK